MQKTRLDIEAALDNVKCKCCHCCIRMSVVVKVVKQRTLSFVRHFTPK